MATAVAGLQGGVKDVLEALTPQPTVNLALPRFKAEWGTHSLVPAKALGVAHPFNGSGGFVGMSDDPELHISDVVHKALIEVNEEGTVAAAATAVIMKTRSLGPPPLRLTVRSPLPDARRAHADGPADVHGAVQPARPRRRLIILDAPAS